MSARVPGIAPAFAKLSKKNAQSFLGYKERSVVCLRKFTLEISLLARHVMVNFISSLIKWIGIEWEWMKQKKME